MVASVSLLRYGAVGAVLRSEATAMIFWIFEPLRARGGGYLLFFVTGRREFDEVSEIPLRNYGLPISK